MEGTRPFTPLALLFASLSAGCGDDPAPAQDAGRAGALSFAAPTRVSTSGAQSIAAGDVNGDRRVELVTNPGANSVAALLGQGDGRFTETASRTWSTPTSGTTP